MFVVKKMSTLIVGFGDFGQNQSFEFLNTVNDFQNVHLINQTKDMYSLEAICNEDIVNMPKNSIDSIGKSKRTITDNLMNGSIYHCLNENLLSLKPCTKKLRNGYWMRMTSWKSMVL